MGGGRKRDDSILRWEFFTHSRRTKLMCTML